MTETPENIRGPVFRPAAEGYDDERTGYQRLASHRPDLVVGATGVDDVRAAVRHAAALGARVAIQGAGHGVNEPMDGGVLISTRRMAGVRVDPAARTAWVEAGAPWAKVIEATAPYGLAPMSGSSPGVGAVPYTLGGGLGLMARKHGFAADHVRRLTMVTADGRVMEVTPEGEPGLFWALRGGGVGGFGVVTGMEIGLLPVTRLYGGGLFFDVAEVPGVLEAWRHWTETVPEEMTSAVGMLPFPDVPQVPEDLRGKHVAQVQIAFLGSEEEGRRLVRPLREIGPPLRDTLRDLPYTESAAVFDEPDQPHAYQSQNRLLRDLDPGMLATLPKTGGPSAPLMCVVQMRHLGGAPARPPRVPSAVGHRAATYSLNALSVVRPGQEEIARRLHDDVLAPFEEQALGRGINFGYGRLTEQEARTAFDPGDYDRLAELKARHDPNGMFHANYPISPDKRDQ
ncbi:FAD-linked oxidoreductase [Spongiactinospora rosea]|uniref:FAD-linked oxidoreductase n=1 Tax=Spongiactinospora rosea TaxID=2248750 RepID=A0A366M594_9ACTN|nr:FAD-binding oxidoreductase [Spongiactinospora rosea]RBQ21365.1 FAD-linked oxidoreductase [Spongiactinospora rosea]